MIYDITIFGIDITINPVAFTIFGWKIYWYGITIALGFVLALVYGIKNAPRFKLNNDRIMDVILVTTPVAILCARTYYLIFDEKPLNSFSEFFGFGDSGFSGLAIYGGVIGAFMCGALMCYLRKVKIFDMFDLAAVGFIIGQAVGRWGNFFNQEAYGAFTGSTWWGMESNRTQMEVGYGLVHPCFLYESIWCIAGFFVLHHFSKNRKFSGEITLMYCVWYGFGRAIIEGLRTDSLYIGTVRVSQMVSILICIAAAVAIILIRSKIKENEESEYVPQFAEQTEETATENETLKEEITEKSESNEINEEEKND